MIQLTLALLTALCVYAALILAIWHPVVMFLQFYIFLFIFAPFPLFCVIVLIHELIK